MSNQNNEDEQIITPIGNNEREDLKLNNEEQREIYNAAIVDENDTEETKVEESFYKPKEAANRIGISVDSLRTYYGKEFESEPYLKGHILREGTHRRYSATAIRMLAKIVKMVQIDNLTLEQVKTKLRQEHGGDLPSVIETQTVRAYYELLEKFNKLDQYMSGLANMNKSLKESQNELLIITANLEKRLAKYEMGGIDKDALAEVIAEQIGKEDIIKEIQEIKEYVRQGQIPQEVKRTFFGRLKYLFIGK